MGTIFIFIVLLVTGASVVVNLLVAVIMIKFQEAKETENGDAAEEEVEKERQLKLLQRQLEKQGVEVNKKNPKMEKAKEFIAACITATNWKGLKDPDSTDFKGDNHWTSAVWFRWLPCCKEKDGSKGWNVRHIILDDESFVNRFILFVIVVNTAIFAMQDAENSPQYVKDLATANVICVWFYAFEPFGKLFIIGFEDTFGSAAEIFGKTRAVRAVSNIFSIPIPIPIPISSKLDPGCECNKGSK